MGKSAELIERFEKMQSSVTELEKEVTREEAVLTVKKKEIDEKRAELEKQGIKFKSLKELKNLQQETEGRIEQQVSRMEEILGGSNKETSIELEEDIEEEYEEVEVEDFDEEFEIEEE